MLLSKLRNYQEEAVEIGRDCLKTDLGYIIGDEMGLGKTVQGLALGDALPKKYGRGQIVCPENLKPKWVDEIKKHLGRDRKYSFSFGSYSQLRNPRNLFAFTKEPVDFVILDEVHYVCDFKALQTRAVLGAPADKHRTVASNTDNIISLSGTWPKNRVGESYPLLYKMKHPLTRNLTYEKFLSKYAESTWKTGFSQELQHKGVKNMDEFRRLLGRNYIRRLLDEVEDIPKFLTVPIPVECTKDLEGEERELLEELLLKAGHTKSEFPLIFNDPEFFDLLLETVPEFPRLVEFRKRQGWAKVKPISEYLLENVLPETEKFIVFTWQTEIAEKYAEILGKKTDKIVLLHGKNSKPEDRFRILKEANAAKRAIIIATLDSISEGHDLTNYTKSFFTEMDWRPHKIEQNQGRTRRIGQTKQGFWYFFMLDKGVEKMMVERVEQKNKDLLEIRGK
jgi:SNF2 family DNA or RNA helicase